MKNIIKYNTYNYSYLNKQIQKQLNFSILNIIIIFIEQRILKIIINIIIFYSY